MEEFENLMPKDYKPKIRREDLDSAQKGLNTTLSMAETLSEEESDALLILSSIRMILRLYIEQVQQLPNKVEGFLIEVRGKEEVIERSELQEDYQKSEETERWTWDQVYEYHSSNIE